MSSNYSDEDLTYARYMINVMLDDIKENAKHGTLQSAIEDARRLVKEVRARAIANYDSHKWITGLSGGPSDPQERMSYCSDCGIENAGNPREFPELEYPHCEDRPDQVL